jgi:YbbR domain-containing protein
MAVRRKNEIMLRVISFLVAIALWFYVGMEQNPNISVNIPNIPLKVQNMGSTLTMTSLSTETVSIRVKGRSGILSGISAKSAQAYIDLEGVKAGTQVLPVQVVVPPNVELVGVVPAEVQVTLEPIVRKQLRVQADLKGELPTGNGALPAQLEPNTVFVEGAQSLVNRADSALVTVDITGFRQATSEVAKVKVIDISGREVPDLTVKPDTVKVTVSVVPTYTVPVEVKIEGEPPPGYIIRNISVDPPEVSVKGEPALVEGLRSVATAPVDVGNARSSISIRVNLELPEGVFLAEPVFPMVNIKIENTNEEETFFDLPVKVKGEAQGSKVEIFPDKVDLTLEGSEQKLAQVKGDQLALFVDVSDLEVGEHQVPLQGNIPDGVRIKEPMKILVKVSKGR